MLGASALGRLAGLSSALAFPLDLGARPLCRRLRGRGCANCHAVSHRKTSCVFFKPWGSNLSQLFRIQFKGVSLELLAPICKREKKRSAPFFLPETCLPALDMGVDRRYTKSFSFLVGLSLSLTDAGAVLGPPSSTTEMGWGCTRGVH